MNNNPKSNEYIQSHAFAELDMDNSINHSSILIKHDYYSSNTNHGKYLLSKFLETLKDAELPIASIYLIDSAVKLLDSSSDYREYLVSLYEKFNCTIYAAEESVDEYGISLLDCQLCECISSSNLFYEITYNNNLIVIE